ncbi:MAG: MarC family protein [Candidatus Micrarchaeota archaeon]
MMLEGSIDYFLTSLIAILVILNPLSTIGVFLSLTKGMKKIEKYKVAFRSSLAAFCILFFFALTGFWIFQIYSITIDAFRIAGGIALMALGINMLFSNRGKEHEKGDFEQIYLVPLAIPLASGPGTITATIVLAGNVLDLVHQFLLWGVLFVACAINYVALRFSENIDRLLGRDGIAAMVKIMGLLVLSVGVQFIITGLKGEFPMFLG